jgi:hypothetical protein
MSDATRLSWTPSNAIVTDVGAPLSHAASVALKQRIPRANAAPAPGPAS